MANGCGPCGTSSAISDVSAVLVNNFAGSKFGPKLTMLLNALDQVEIRMRNEPAPVVWKPSQFASKIVPYGQKPEGTEIVAKNTPIYFVDNAPYVYDFYTPSPEGGLCEGSTMCGEPPANQVPGDTYQSFPWRMQGTAWETPLFCLKDLLFKENGIDYLNNFLKNVERTPFDFYNNYIRNLIWNVGEKYGLAEHDKGFMWNTPNRVSQRIAPNLLDFQSASPAAGNADFATPKMVALQYMKYILETFLGSDINQFNVNGQPTLMLVGTEPDMFATFYNDTDVPVKNWANGGMGFNMFSFEMVSKLPYVFKNDPDWFRGRYDDDGEFQIVPAKLYVPQNGGMDLRVNPDWLTADYGVMTFMTANPFWYRQFGELPAMGGQIPQESTRWLRPRFQFVPLLEKCNYARGIVGWRAEDEFGFQPTGEKIIHVIYRRDGLGSYLRAAKQGAPITVTARSVVTVPDTCSMPQVLGCCPVAGIVSSAVDYRDTTYSVTYDGNIIESLGINIAGLPGTPVTAKFATAKGTFDVKIFAVNAAGNIINFGVNPTEHKGGHFCCTDQLLGFLATGATVTKYCQALLDGGLQPTSFDPTLFIGHMSRELDAAVNDVVAVFFDTGCGENDYVEMTVDSIDNVKRRIFLTIDPADFPNGINCDDARKVCAFNTVNCPDCTASSVVACDPDDVAPIPGFGDPSDADDHES